MQRKYDEFEQILKQIKGDEQYYQNQLSELKFALNNGKDITRFIEDQGDPFLVYRLISEVPKKLYSTVSKSVAITTLVDLISLSAFKTIYDKDNVRSIVPKDKHRQIEKLSNIDNLILAFSNANLQKYSGGSQIYLLLATLNSSEIDSALRNNVNVINDLINSFMILDKHHNNPNFSKYRDVYQFLEKMKFDKKNDLPLVGLVLHALKLMNQHVDEDIKKTAKDLNNFYKAVAILECLKKFISAENQEKKIQVLLEYSENWRLTRKRNFLTMGDPTTIKLIKSLMVAEREKIVTHKKKESPDDWTIINSEKEIKEQELRREVDRYKAALEKMADSMAKPKEKEVAKEKPIEISPKQQVMQESEQTEKHGEPSLEKIEKPESKKKVIAQEYNEEYMDALQKMHMEKFKPEKDVAKNEQDKQEMLIDYENNKDFNQQEKAPQKAIEKNMAELEKIVKAEQEKVEKKVQEKQKKDETLIDLNFENNVQHEKKPKKTYEDYLEELRQLKVEDHEPVPQKKEKQAVLVETEKNSFAAVAKNKLFQPKVKQEVNLIQELKDTFECPIGYGEMMEDPVRAEDGQTYERKNIENWLKKYKISPKQNKEMGTLLIPNTNVKKFIEKYEQGDHETLIQMMRCPLTNTVIKTPVIAEDGKIYEKNNIEFYLASHNKSPVTNEPMGKKLINDYKLTEIFEAYQKAYPDFVQKNTKPQRKP